MKISAEELAWLRLHLTRGLGRKRLLRLAEAFGSADAILSAGQDAWRDRAGIEPDLERAIPAADQPEVVLARRTLEGTEARLLPFGDPDFPPLLRAIPDPPALLYVRGKIPAEDALAVVGSRRATYPGRSLTTEICAELATRGIVIVSGLARGIDTAAHQGALEGGGATVAVLGCGIDRIYPPENTSLARQLLEKGAIITEYPPGTPPLAHHFPGRNRIISGLCRGVLVVEAAAASGSLISAEFALEQGREVFAVPGPVQSPGSEGVHQLLKDGAHLVTGAADILSLLWPTARPREVLLRESAFAESLSGDARRLFDCLEETPVHIDHLVRKSGLTPMEVSAILLHLELQGGVKTLPGPRYQRSRIVSNRQRETL